MFCAKCGAADQQPENYCRNCGFFLPDMLKAAKKASDPHMHIKINSTLTLLSALVSLAMAVSLLVLFAGRPGTHWLIYLAQAMFTANFFWQTQTFWRTRLLKKHLPLQRTDDADKEIHIEKVKPTDELLMPAPAGADIEQPASVTEHTTKLLIKK